jgi:hypothetical protein
MNLKFNQMLADANASIKYHTAMTTIKCEQKDDNLIIVNGKEVRKDMNGNWVGKTLDIKEAKFFNVFLNTINNIGSGKLLEASYKM